MKLIAKLTAKLTAKFGFTKHKIHVCNFATWTGVRAVSQLMVSAGVSGVCTHDTLWLETNEDKDEAEDEKVD